MGLREEGYWDSHYELELKNYIEDGDEGEVWFGQGLSRKIVDCVIKRIDSLLTQDDKIKLIDIGCGNAFIPCMLIEKLQPKTLGSNGDAQVHVTGIDYSENCIKLAKKIINDKNLNHCIDLRQCDFLNEQQLEDATSRDGYQFIIDKGTLDAICLLSPANEIEETKLKYLKSLYKLVRHEALFILASCNQTESELLSLFKNQQLDRSCGSKFIDRIETPKIQFGGKEGSQVSCVVMQLTKVDRLST